MTAISLSRKRRTSSARSAEVKVMSHIINKRAKLHQNLRFRF
jgi:hypothetical protein